MDLDLLEKALPIKAEFDRAEKICKFLDTIHGGVENLVVVSIGTEQIPGQLVLTEMEAISIIAQSKTYYLNKMMALKNKLLEL